MQTLQPTLRLGRDVWDRTNMPVEEFQDRVEKMRAEMRRAEIDVLLLYGNGLDGCGYPTYLSNYTPKLPFAALVLLPREGEPVLMFQGSTRGRSAAQATTWIEDTRPCWDIADTCIAALAEKNLLSATVGLAGVRRMMPYDQWRKVSAELARADLKDAEPFVDRLRAIKSPREMAQIRRAWQIPYRSLNDLHTRRFEIMKESLVTAHLMREARMQGAEDVRVLIGRPRESGWAFRPPEDRAIAEGETVFVHLGASWERYWSEAIRTYCAESGNLEVHGDEAQEKQFQSILAWLEPGRTIAEFAGMAASSIMQPYGLGHSIGNTPTEPPMLSADNQTRIEPGMCFSVRLALPDRRHGFIAWGDTVIVD